MNTEQGKTNVEAENRALFGGGFQAIIPDSLIRVRYSMPIPLSKKAICASSAPLSDSFLFRNYLPMVFLLCPYR
jgi:hypothetical protein